MRIQVISLRLTEFLNFLFYFFRLVYAETRLTIQKAEIFIISLFSIVQIIALESRKTCFFEFLVDILPLGSGSVDPHIFANPDPESQNRADTTDPNPES